MTVSAFPYIGDCISRRKSINRRKYTTLTQRSDPPSNWTILQHNAVMIFERDLLKENRNLRLHSSSIQRGGGKKKTFAALRLWCNGPVRLQRRLHLWEHPLTGGWTPRHRTSSILSFSLWKEQEAVCHEREKKNMKRLRDETVSCADIRNGFT